jgi:hypothetical protein
MSVVLDPRFARAGGMIAPRPRVYAAHPMASYGTDHERSRLVALGGLLPGVELFNPSRRYSTNVGWRRAWPRVLASLSGLVVFPGENGTIGTGCLRELTDAVTWGLPIAALEGEALREIDGLKLVSVPRRSARHAARLILSGPIEPSQLLAVSKVPDG